VPALFNYVLVAVYCTSLLSLLFSMTVVRRTLHQWVARQLRLTQLCLVLLTVGSASIGTLFPAEQALAHSTRALDLPPPATCGSPHAVEITSADDQNAHLCNGEKPTDTWCWVANNTLQLSGLAAPPSPPQEVASVESIAANVGNISNKFYDN